MVVLSEFARSKHAKRIIAAMAAVGVAAVIWSSMSIEDPSVPFARLSSKPTRVAIFTAGLEDKYFDMVLGQMTSIRRHFCAGKPHYDVHYFVFTDRNASSGAVSDAGVTFIHKQRRGWPRDSDDRYSWLVEAGSLMDGFEYALWMDADNHLIADCCEDLLGTLVALRHGYSYSSARNFGYESNKTSQAYVPQSTKFVNPYFSAHIFGGKVPQVQALAEACANWTLTDRQAGIKAVWDDESYLQRYFKEHMPTVVLSFAFLYPEGREVPWANTVTPMGKAMWGGHGRRLAAASGVWGRVDLDLQQPMSSRKRCSRDLGSQPHTQR